MEPRRIRPPAIYDGKGGVIEKLIDGGAFESKQALMMFAASLGRYLGKRQKLEKFGEGIRWQVFERNEDDCYVNALALSVTQSIQVLGERGAEGEDAPTIFEEYAAAGLQHIDEQIMKVPGDPVDLMLAIVAEAKQRERATPAGLEGLSPDALEFLGAEGEREKS